MAWTPNRIVALILGIVLALLGLVGFLVAPTMAKGTVMGFDVDLIQNLVHLVSGVLAIAAVLMAWPRRYNQIFGIIFLLLGLAGVFYPALYFNGMLLGLMHANATDHILHILIGIVAIATGFSQTEATVTATPDL